jgi:hypothetical protein
MYKNAISAIRGKIATLEQERGFYKNLDALPRVKNIDKIIVELEQAIKLLKEQEEK